MQTQALVLLLSIPAARMSGGRTHHIIASDLTLKGSQAAPAPDAAAPAAADKKADAPADAPKPKKKKV